MPNKYTGVSSEQADVFELHYSSKKSLQSAATGATKAMSRLIGSSKSNLSTTKRTT
jgi:hypothetical protein